VDEITTPLNGNAEFGVYGSGFGVSRFGGQGFAFKVWGLGCIGEEHLFEKRTTKVVLQVHPVWGLRLGNQGSGFRDSLFAVGVGVLVSEGRGEQLVVFRGKSPHPPRNSASICGNWSRWSPTKAFPKPKSRLFAEQCKRGYF